MIASFARAVFFVPDGLIAADRWFWMVVLLHGVLTCFIVISKSPHTTLNHFDRSFAALNVLDARS